MPKTEFELRAGEEDKRNQARYDSETNLDMVARVMAVGLRNRSYESQDEQDEAIVGAVLDKVREEGLSDEQHDYLLGLVRDLV